MYRALLKLLVLFKSDPYVAAWLFIDAAATIAVISTLINL